MDPNRRKRPSPGICRKAFRKSSFAFLSFVLDLLDPAQLARFELRAACRPEADAESAGRKCMLGLLQPAADGLTDLWNRVVRHADDGLPAVGPVVVHLLLHGVDQRAHLHGRLLRPLRLLPRAKGDVVVFHNTLQNDSATHPKINPRYLNG